MNKDQMFSSMTTRNEMFMLFMGTVMKCICKASKKPNDIDRAKKEAYEDVKEMIHFNQIRGDKHSLIKMCFMFEAMGDAMAASIRATPEGKVMLGGREQDAERMIQFSKHLIEHIFAGFIGKDEFGHYINDRETRDLEQDEVVSRINDHLREILKLAGRVKP